MRGGIFGSLSIAALGLCIGGAAAADTVVGGLAFPLDPQVWQAEGDRLVCRAQDCDGAAVRVSRVEAPCDDALLASLAEAETGRGGKGVRILPARDLHLRVLIATSPCRSLSADPVFACVTVGGVTRLVTTESARGHRCAMPLGAPARVLDLLGRAGKP